MTKKILLATLVFSLLMLLNLGSAKASFVANDLIDDGVFDNAGSMSAAQIDSWINSKFPNSCISTNNGFTSPEPTGFTPAGGFTYGGNVSAGTVISSVTKVYGLNPQVILATLEKESSVVSGNASYHCQYINTAMGYDCPDSGSCPQNPAKESGFSKQVTYATWMLKFHEQRSEGNIGWNVQIHDFPHSGNIWDNSDDPESSYGGRVTQGYRQVVPSGPSNYYDGYTTIDGTSVHLDTGATAALYDYTPYFHGNQLFVGYFEQWFGSAVGELVRTAANAQVYLTNTVNGYKYPINSPSVMNDFSTLGLRFVSDAYLSQFAAGQAVGNMVQGPDGSLYLVNAGIKLPFSSCSGDVVDYGYTCASNQFVPLTPGQTNKLVSGPGITRLIKSNTDSTIYYVSKGIKRPIQSWDDLVGLHLNQGINTLNNPFVSSLPTWYPIYRPGALIKYPSSQSVYVVNDTDTALQISSYRYPQELGLNTTTRIVGGGYSPSTSLENKVLCSGNNYVGTNGDIYQVSPSMMTSFGFTSGQFVAAGNICLNVPVSSNLLTQYIRTSEGTIYYVSNGKKQAFSSYDTYQSPAYCNNSACTVIPVSNSFAGSILSAPNL